MYRLGVSGQAAQAALGGGGGRQLHAAGRRHEVAAWHLRKFVLLSCCLLLRRMLCRKNWRLPPPLLRAGTLRLLAAGVEPASLVI